MAVPAGTSPSSIGRLEKGDPGVGIGALVDVLVALGLADRLSDLIDIRKDELGLALAVEQLPRLGQSFATQLRRPAAKANDFPDATVTVNQHGVSF